MHKSSIKCALSLLLFFCDLRSIQAEIIEQDRGLNGCTSLDSMASTSDARVMAVACYNSPRGVYVSTDSGASWRFAKGGIYSVGSASHVQIIGNKIFAIIGGYIGLAQAVIPATPDKNWTPKWSSIHLPSPARQLPYSLSSDANFLLIASPTIGSSDFFLDVFDTMSGTVVTSSALPVTELQRAQYIVVLGEYIYLQRFFSSSLYRASFDRRTGQIGAWSDVSGASGFPSGTIKWIGAAQDLGYLYVQSESGTVVSFDNASSFSPVTLANRNKLGKIINKGQILMIGTNLSTNGGVSFRDMGLDKITDVSHEKITEALLLHPSDPDRAFAATETGIVTANVLPETPNWTKISNGLQGIRATAIAHPIADSNKALLATDAGVAITKNYLGDLPSWTYPACPSTLGCSKASSPAFDPNDSGVAYISFGGAYKLNIDYSGLTPTATFAPFGSPGAVRLIQTSQHIPDLVLVAPSFGEGLYFLKASDGTIAKITLMNYKINSLVVISNKVIFASAGRAGARTTVTRTLLRSDDGGDNWNVVTDSALPVDLLINTFAYDAANDILYAGSHADVEQGVFATSGDVYVLNQALNNSSTWTKPAIPYFDRAGTLGVYSLSIDPQTFHIYAVSRDLYVSKDRGITWSLLYPNTPGFYINFVDVARLPRSATFSEQRESAEYSPLLTIKGDDSGINKLTQIGTRPISCELSVMRKCSGKPTIKPGELCTFAITAHDAETGDPLKTRVRLQTRQLGKRAWEQFAEFRTNSKGRKTFKLTSSRSFQVRGLFISPKCKTSAVTVAIKD